MTRPQSLLLGIVTALVFIFLAAYRLDAPGLYYDELHQAPASFRYVGSHPVMFSREIHRVPVLNMSYSGAIKSAVYGFYLRFINHHFSVFSWRMLGILFVAAGIIVFFAAAGTRLPIASGLIFGMLLTTDVTVLITSRHDWGPTALALGLRLALLGIWLSIGLGRPSRAKYFVAGLLVSIAVFEKLAAVVLLGPLILLLASSFKKNRQKWTSVFAGLAVGGVPLMLVNIWSLKNGAGLVSFSNATGSTSLHFGDVADYVYQLLAIGHGELARSLVFGIDAHTLWANGEAAIMAVLLALVVFAALQRGRSDRFAALAGWCIGAFALVSFGLLILPRDTYVHHWIQVTPFQYAAIALAWSAFSFDPGSGSRSNRYRIVFQILLAVLIVIRIGNLVTTGQEFAAGRTSPGFNLDFTRLGELASAKSADASILAADWGTGTQVYCLGNGQDDLVYEPFWVDASQRTKNIVASTKKNELYVVSAKLDPQFNDAAKAVIDAMSSSPGWAEMPIEETFANLSSLKIRKFVRR